MEVNSRFKRFIDDETGRSYLYDEATGDTRWEFGSNEEWLMMVDPKSKRPFWYNQFTKKSTWHNPYSTEVKHEYQSRAKPHPETKDEAKARKKEESEWATEIDKKSGKRYWYNEQTGQSTWIDPLSSNNVKQAKKKVKTTTKLGSHSSLPWDIYWDSQNNRAFYRNRQSKVSQWECPVEIKAWAMSFLTERNERSSESLQHKEDRNGTSSIQEQLEHKEPAQQLPSGPLLESALRLNNSQMIFEEQWQNSSKMQDVSSPGNRSEATWGETSLNQRMERALKVLETSERLLATRNRHRNIDDSLVSLSKATVLMEGELYEQIMGLSSPGEWRLRYFLLTDDQTLHSVSAENHQHELSRIDIKELTGVQPHRDDPCVFSLSASLAKHVATLRAENPESARRWMEILSKVLASSSSVDGNRLRFTVSPLKSDIHETFSSTRLDSRRIGRLQRLLEQAVMLSGEIETLIGSFENQYIDVHEERLEFLTSNYQAMLSSNFRPSTPPRDENDQMTKYSELWFCLRRYPDLIARVGAALKNNEARRMYASTLVNSLLAPISAPFAACLHAVVLNSKRSAFQNFIYDAIAASAVATPLVDCIREVIQSTRDDGLNVLRIVHTLQDQKSPLLRLMDSSLLKHLIVEALGSDSRHYSMQLVEEQCARALEHYRSATSSEANIAGPFLNLDVWLRSITTRFELYALHVALLKYQGPISEDVRCALHALGKPKAISVRPSNSPYVLLKKEENRDPYYQIQLNSLRHATKELTADAKDHSSDERRQKIQNLMDAVEASNQLKESLINSIGWINHARQLGEGAAYNDFNVEISAIEPQTPSVLDTSAVSL